MNALKCCNVLIAYWRTYVSKKVVNIHVFLTYIVVEAPTICTENERKEVL